jgi:hypothetical protein
MRRLALVFACVCSCASSAALAEQCTGPQLGTWRLLSFTARDPDTGEITAPYGLYPTGFLSYTPDCRMYSIIVREHRTAPAAIVASDAEKTALFDGIMTYAGTYTLSHDTLSYRVDASWNEAWTGSTRVQHFRIDGNTLYTDAPPAKNPRDGKSTAESFVWTRLH